MIVSLWVGLVHHVIDMHDVVWLELLAAKTLACGPGGGGHPLAQEIKPRLVHHAGNVAVARDLLRLHLAGLPQLRQSPQISLRDVVPDESEAQNRKRKNNHVRHNEDIA